MLGHRYSFRFIPMLVVGLLGIIGLAPAVSAPPPVSYQGDLRRDGAVVHGLVRFKFALVRAQESLWSHDGTSRGGSEPAGAIGVQVDQGIFAVLLGGDGMLPLTEDLIGEGDGVALRTWVDTGDGFEQLSDQPLTAAPLALRSVSAEHATGDFRVSGALTVEGGAGVAGEVIAGGVRLTAGALVFADGSVLERAPAGGGMVALENTDGSLDIQNPTGPTVTVNLRDRGVPERKLALDFPTHSQANDPTPGEKAALAGTSGTPHEGNRYVTASDPRLSDARIPAGSAGGDLAGAFPNPAIGAGKVVKTINNLKDAVTLAGGANVTLTQSDNTITISAAGTGSGGVPSVNGITNAVTLRGEGGTVVSTRGDTLTIRSAGGGSGILGIQNVDGALSITHPEGPIVSVDARPLGIGNAQLAPGAVTTDKVLDGTLLAGDLAPGAVTTTAILDGTVVDADVASGAAIEESKLALNFPTHDNANDPSAGEKAALAGTNGTPGAQNRFVTSSDARLDDARTPAGAAAGDLTGSYPAPILAAGRVVKSINNLKDAVSLAAGTNVTLTTNQNTITIAASSTGTSLGAAYNHGGPGGGRAIYADAGPLLVDGPDGLVVLGKLGVGVLEPAARFHVHGLGTTPPISALNSEELVVSSGAAANLGLYGGSGSQGTGLSLGEFDSGNLLSKWSLVKEPLQQGGGLRFTVGTSPYAVINPTTFYLGDDGLAGIGIATPRNQLHVHNPGTFGTQPWSLAQFTTAETGAAVSDGLHVGVLPLGSEGQIGHILHKENAPLRIGTNNLIGQLVLRESGAVGVGIADPQGRLDVLANSSGTSPQIMVSEQDTGFGRISYRSTGVAGKYWTTAARSESVDSGSQYNVWYFNGTSGQDILSVNGTGKVGVNTTSPVEALDVNGTVRTNGEVNRTSTGSANLVPICYGNAGSNGAIKSGTGNFTVSRIGVGRYEITISGESFVADNYAVSVTVIGSPGGFATFGSSGGKLLVETYQIVGGIVSADRGFAFMVYKP